MRLLVVLALCCLSTHLLAAVAPVDPAAFPEPVRVACVGDSITAGSGAPKGKSYPDQLQALLGASWAVKNFGVSGHTLLRKGDHPYWKAGAFAKAKEFQPNVVVILLGANDSKPGNWKYGEEFPTDYRDLVAEFRALPSQPRIWVGRPCPVPGKGNFGINEATIQKQILLINQMADDLKLGVIDFHAALADKPQFIPDRVHPNADGYGVMAATVAAALTGKTAP